MRLFEACADAGVRRVVLISASGAEQPTSSYWGPRRPGERCLERLGMEGRSPTGRSSGRRSSWAVAAPARPVPRPCGAAVWSPASVDPGRLRPIHVPDLAATIADVVLRASRSVPSLSRWAGASHARWVLDRYRASLGLAPAPHLPISFGLLAGLGRLAHWLGAPPPLDAEPVQLAGAGARGRP